MQEQATILKKLTEVGESAAKTYVFMKIGWQGYTFLHLKKIRLKEDKIKKINNRIDGVTT